MELFSKQFLLESFQVIATRGGLQCCNLLLVTFLFMRLVLSMWRIGLQHPRFHQHKPSPTLVTSIDVALVEKWILVIWFFHSYWSTDFVKHVCHFSITVGGEVHGPFASGHDQCSSPKLVSITTTLKEFLETNSSNEGREGRILINIPWYFILS